MDQEEREMAQHQAEVDLGFLDEGPGELNDWLRLERPKPGDSLIVTVTDGPARQATIRLERRAERDQTAVAARNGELRAAAEAWLQATGDRLR